MIRTTIKLLIALAILNAVARAAVVAWTYYQFRDEAQHLVVFGADVPPAELKEDVLAKAAELDVPIEGEDIEVSRAGTETFITVSYTHPVELFPRVFYPMPLSFSVEAFDVRKAPRKGP